MIQRITDLPTNMVGFRATGEVTEEDFKNEVEPVVKQLVDTTGRLNYLLLLDTDIDNFTAGAWFRDAWMGIKHLTDWERAAIVTDSEGVIKFTDGFSYVAPGEYRGFKKADYTAAVNWVSEGK